MFRPKALAIIAGCGAAAYFVGGRLTDLKTPGVKNIEERHRAAGGGANHTPSQGSTLGDKYNDSGKALQEKGIGSKYFEENFANQKVGPTSPGKAINRTKHGTDSDVH